MHFRFEFPLEIEEAALGGVTIEINNKKIVAQMKEKEKAQKTYVRIKQIEKTISNVLNFRMMQFRVDMERIWWNKPMQKSFQFKLVRCHPRNLSKVSSILISILSLCKLFIFPIPLNNFKLKTFDLVLN